MRVPIPHDLPREEVRRRLRDNIHRLGDQIPGGMAQVEHAWPSEDRMDIGVSAMGQAVRGHVDIEDNRVVVEFTLPPMLSFMQPVVEKAVEANGQKLLAPKRD